MKNNREERECKMVNTKKQLLKLKIGNLILAICLATVPTLITYGVLSIHGLNICKNLNATLTIGNQLEIQEKCNESAWITTKSYIFLIGFFITLPTWMWIYLSMRKKVFNKKS